MRATYANRVKDFPADHLDSAPAAFDMDFSAFLLLPTILASHIVHSSSVQSDSQSDSAYGTHIAPVDG